jgi:hypothetical protein
MANGMIGFRLVLILLGIGASVLHAQRSDRKMPVSFGLNIAPDVPRIIRVDRPEEKILEIQRAGNTEKYLDFGVAIPVQDQGMAIVEPILLQDGKSLLRYKIEAPGAFGINLNFREFYPGKSGKLWIYNESRSHVLGAFDLRSYNPGIPFATAPVPGEACILEFVFDPTEEGIKLELAEVVYEFEDLFSAARGFGDAGWCNRNVNCPEYGEFGNARRSVAMTLTANNVRRCTGTLINNVQQDGRPFFLTAKHCNTAPNSIFMFNYESPDCSNLEGTLNQTIQGATVLVDWAPSDVTLMELSSLPPSDYFVYYSGWNAESLPADSVYGIHHPRGDIKKISFDYDLVSSATYNPPDTALNHWKVGSWEVGTTEGGSSGSPLFNRSGQVLGQLHGGVANCANSINDYYGRFDYSWYGLGTPSSAVRFWLDPEGTGHTQWNGFDFTAPQHDFDLSVVSLLGADSIVCAPETEWTVTIRNTGLLATQGFTVKLFHGNTAVDSVQVNQVLQYGQTASVSFSQIQVQPGVQEFSAVVFLQGQQSDQNTSSDTLFRTVERISGDEVKVSFEYDLFSGETQWGIYRMDGSSVFISPAAGPYENMIRSFCLPEGCYLFRAIDTGNDGICCSGGEGSFSLSGSGGNQLLGYEPFENVFERKFCVPALPQGWEPLFQLYPNPSSDFLNIKLQAFAEGYDGEVLIFTPEGKEMARISGALKYLNTFAVSDWAKGVYFVRVAVGKLKSVQKWIKF